MKTYIIFWGVLLISLGIALTLNNFELLNFDFSFALKMWPIILIIWGLTFLKISEILKKILAAISALFLTLLFIALIKFDWFSALRG